MFDPESTFRVPFEAHVMEGAILSCTVTVAVHVSILPAASITVRVTVLPPMFEQVNDEGETERLVIPVSSVEPPST